ncbi:acyl-CoA dehydrogenase [Rhodococcus sp. 114MFTsu3.1]|uniref:acyl-CoA dehydrogenase n=1 Tax=Rhodococcus sp. 114MFTsu3.1 TaxID=1172184 RepID=UPI0003A6974F|nr:acyl-CoA dehydrogenase [Rhodococcus sp. 114MFTsu3.1]
MTHYKSNVRDIVFNLFDVFELDQILGTGTYLDLDTQTVNDILVEVSRLAEGPVAASFEISDREPTTFDVTTNSVTVPPELAKTARLVAESGWPQLGLPSSMGGSDAPAVLVWAVNEMLSAANGPLTFFNFSTIIGQVVHEFGTDNQKRWALSGLERGWSATMVLTEPDAGSDVGAGRTRAVPQADGTWHIEGVKRFITNGDVGDFAENIFHLVLARPEGAGSGTKGLSLFYVPKWHFDPATMELGARNGVFVTGVERKMGLKSSPTCELTFGGNGVPAVGWLIGDAHDGIAQMFKIIEAARMTVGTKAIGTLSTGYLNAVEYAKQRIQGADLAHMRVLDAPKVSIMRHPAVRHSLALQKAYAEGMRAVYLYTAAHQNAEIAAHVSGANPDLAKRINDLLLPVVKGVGSERTCEMLTRSLQIFGGSGYLQDYPLEQYLRDSIIDTLYEGTTAIQAQDLIFRKILRDRGETFEFLAAQIERSITSPPEQLVREADISRAALTAIRRIISKYALWNNEPGSTEVYKIGLSATRFLDALGDLLVAWRLFAQATVALDRLATGPDPQSTIFYRGKVVTASYFIRTTLPSISGFELSLDEIDLDLMNLEEDAF